MKRYRNTTSRSGASAVELALLLPFLVFLFVITIDFGRVYYYSLTLTNCARDGALYASDPVTQQHSPYSVLNADGVTVNLNASVPIAALAEAPLFANLQSKPTVAPPYFFTDANGRSLVQVSVTYQFNTISRIPLVPDSFTLTRTVTMEVAPQRPS
jgi:Flp pilus assembly protein TadG